MAFDGQEEVGELELAPEFKIEIWELRIVYKKYERENLSASFKGTYERAKERFSQLLEQATAQAMNSKGEREIARVATQRSTDEAILESRRRAIEEQEREELERETAAQCKVAGECRRCGEDLWQIRSVSPNLKSVTWQCEYCGSVVMVRRQDNKNVDMSTRRSIPKEAQREVWRRDQGRCMTCGSRENLEFDHIIPLSKGGANTARNLQLLCQQCNREKSDNIG